MTEDIRKSSAILYRIWLLLCAAGCIVISVYGKRLPLQYQGKIPGIAACILMALLSLFAFVTDDAGLAGGFAPAKGAPGKGRRTAAVIFAVFLAGAAAETVYFRYGIRAGRTNLTYDALAGAGIFTALSLAARKIVTVRSPSGP